MEKRVGNSLRRRIGEILMHQLVLLLLSLQVIGISSLAMVLGHKVPNFRSVELAQPHPTLFANFVESFIVDILRRGRI